MTVDQRQDAAAVFDWQLKPICRQRVTTPIEMLCSDQLLTESVGGVQFARCQWCDGTTVEVDALQGLFDMQRQAVVSIAAVPIK